MWKFGFRVQPFPLLISGHNGVLDNRIGTQDGKIQIILLCVGNKFDVQLWSDRRAKNFMTPSSNEQTAFEKLRRMHLQKRVCGAELDAKPWRDEETRKDSQN